MNEARTKELVAKGRPEVNTCECSEWPCWCVCHSAHAPGIEHEQPASHTPMHVLNQILRPL